MLDEKLKVKFQVIILLILHQHHIRSHAGITMTAGPQNVMFIIFYKEIDIMSEYAP